MNNLDLIKQLVKRLIKYSWVIIIFTALFGYIFYYIAKQNVAIYTAKSTVFPLNAQSDGGGASSAINSLLGTTSGNVIGDASISILELATSRRTKDVVSKTRLSTFNNKMIAELLIDENNNYVGFKQNTFINKPKDTLSLINTASGMIGANFSTKFNKNGILEIYFSNSNPDLVREISYVFIDKISEFYIDLKKKKAQLEYDFAVKKADSLLKILNILDKKTIQLDETTYFTNNELKKFEIPKQNLLQEKTSILSQYRYAVNNRESAAYVLQKQTPIIEILDKPEGPYSIVKLSKTTNTIIGIVIGLFIGILFVSIKIIKKLISVEIKKSLSTPKQS